MIKYVDKTTKNDKKQYINITFLKVVNTSYVFNRNVSNIIVNFNRIYRLRKRS